MLYYSKTFGFKIIQTMAFLKSAHSLKSYAFFSKASALLVATMQNMGLFL